MGKAREAVVELDVSKLTDKDGVKNVISKLDALYLEDTHQSSLDTKTKEVGAEDCVNQNLDGSVQENVADCDNGLKENVSNEGLISSGLE